MSALVGMLPSVGGTTLEKAMVPATVAAGKGVSLDDAEGDGSPEGNASGLETGVSASEPPQAARARRAAMSDTESAAAQFVLLRCKRFTARLPPRRLATRGSAVLQRIVEVSDDVVIT